MSPIRIQPAQNPHGEVPWVEGMTPEASLTCIRGNAIKIDGDGEAIIHPLATTVDDFYGIALCDVTAGVSDSPSGELQVARCTTNQTFCGQVVAGGVDADVVLTDLKSYERLIVHTELADEPSIETYSEGEGRHRRLVISPVSNESSDW